LERIINKALEKDRELRYQHASEMRTDLQRLKRDSESDRSVAQSVVLPPARRAWRWITAAAVVVVAVALAASYFYRRASAAKLTDKDTIVLAEFTNATGDPVFDGALRQGLSLQLEQSPFLNLLSDSRIAQTLTLMTRPKDTRLTPELAREVCQRTASAATIEGSISSLGSQYVLGLKAVNCSSGDLMSQEQATANGKEQVLKALDDAATKLRAKLGESLTSMQKFDTKLWDATTPSLEALQAFSLGVDIMNVKGDSAGAVPLLQQAVSLDPNFAVAYANLGTAYANVGQSALAAGATRRAYELRARVSEKEKLYIVSHYEGILTGNLEAARRTYELWAQTYPRDGSPTYGLGVIYSALGDYEKALAAKQLGLQLNPSQALRYSNLAVGYLNLNRLSEAKAVAIDAQSRHLDASDIPLLLYIIAFLQHDAAGMEHEAQAALSKPGYEDEIFNLRSATAAYAGQFGKARELMRRAMSSAERSDKKEVAAAYQAEAAVQEALVGNLTLAKQQAGAALAISNGRKVEYMAAVALDLAGDPNQAGHLAEDLAQRYPENTLVKSNYLPVIQALVALQKGDGAKGGNHAIETLAAAEPYELGAVNLSLYPIYVRGEAFLTAGQGQAAVAEFQKILNHPGVVANEIIGALAHLQLGRAYVLSGDTAKARTAYQDFLTLWKDADPDVPVLKAAKAEYARLQ